MGLFTETKRVILGSKITDAVSLIEQQIAGLTSIKNQLLDYRKTASEDPEYLPEDVAAIDAVIADVQAKISAI